MNILFLSSAMPVRFGTVRQRLAYSQRKVLQGFGHVRTVVIDAWQTEWSARLHGREGDRFFGHARSNSSKAQGNFLSAARLGSVLPLDTVEQGLTDALSSGWMNSARMTRLSRFVAADAPDLIVCSDPVLRRVAPSFVPAGIPLVTIGEDLKGWARHTATMMRDFNEHSWFSQLAQLADYCDDTACNPVAPPVYIEQEQSDLFFIKSSSVVVPATGIHWLDRRILQHLEAIKLDQGHGDEDPPVKMVLVGFDPRMAAQYCPSGEVQTGWTRLHTLIAVARALFVPYLTPDIRPLVEAALSVGTPVLMRLSDKRHYAIPSQQGVFAVLETHLSVALQNAVSGMLTTESYCREISEQAHRSMLSDTRQSIVWAEWLSAQVGRPVAALETPSTLPPEKHSPIYASPSVHYNRITRMLLVQVEVAGWSLLEELRLFDGRGNELTRLAPTAHQQTQPRYVIEGGLICDLEDLGGAIRIDGYCDIEPLFSHTVQVSDFRTVDAGVVACAHENGTLRLTFWAARGDHDTQWAAEVDSIRAVATRRADMSFEDLGLDVWQVRLPLPRVHSNLLSVSLLKAGSSSSREHFITPIQKTFEIPTARAITRTPSASLGRLKDIHRGRRAWIIGNGPSVRLEDLARIPKDDIVFCFNRFYLSYDSNPLRETYVVSADTLMIQDFGQEMIDRSEGLPLFCIGADHLAGLQGDYVRLPPGAASVPDFSFDPEHHVSVGGSSVYVALQIAWHMGLRDVVLYGMDYSFSSRLVRDPRYPFPVSFDEGNHFIKSYRNAKAWCPPTWRDISAGFLNARIAFEMTGGTVLNATRGGRLETFRRVDFEQLFVRGFNGAKESV